MTKIYVVKVANLKESSTCTTEVFTNRRKAEAFADYWNLIMKDTHHYWIQEYNINNDDYTEQLKFMKKFLEEEG